MCSNSGLLELNLIHLITIKLDDETIDETCLLKDS